MAADAGRVGSPWVTRLDTYQEALRLCHRSTRHAVQKVSKGSLQSSAGSILASTYHFFGSIDSANARRFGPENL